MTAFYFTGKVETFTVKASGAYSIIGYGGNGGYGYGTSAGVGRGAEVGGYFSVQAGEVLKVFAGGRGASAIGPKGGGGGGGASVVLADVDAAGHLTPGTYTNLLIAAGGGGAYGTLAGGDGQAAPLGTGQGGDAGPGTYGGGGGAGVRSNGGSNYAGGDGGTTATAAAGGGQPGNGKNGGGRGGFGGGGGGGGKGLSGLAGGGGGGGGYTGGAGGYRTAGGGGSSLVSGQPIASHTVSGSGFQPFGGGAVFITTVCYVAGTRIRTAQGDVAVETLRIGDRVVAASGACRPIRWLGRRTVDCRRHPRPGEVMPVRIAAHAFGPDRPARDLRVSPGHAICVDLVGEVLIPASALINGATVVQEAVDAVTYWHVELDSHDILLADNLPCESYLDMGNRAFFAGNGVVALDASPDAAVPTHADFCRPFHAGGPIVAFARERLAARAEELGWRLEDASLADDLGLEVDGVRLAPELRGLAARFLVPAGAGELWLVSPTTVPAHVGSGSDARALGVCLGAVTIDDGFGAPRTIMADDPRLCLGFHDVEAGPQRWTAGRARLPTVLWEGVAGAFFLRLDMARLALPRWAPPDVPRLSKGAVATARR